MRLRHGVGVILAAVVLAGSTDVLAQSKPYRGPTDEAGEKGAQRFGLMNGNRILLRFSNRVSLGGWPNPMESLWPNDDTGLNTLDEFNLIIGNMVFLANDSIPVKTSLPHWTTSRHCFPNHAPSVRSGAAWAFSFRTHAPSGPPTSPSPCRPLHW